MKAAVGAAGATSLSGCAGLLEGDSDGEVDPVDEEFQYAFRDTTGTLGNISDVNADPEEASEFQVVENGLSEDEWDEMRRDDVEVARDYLSGDLERRPNHSGQEGTVEEIVQRTGEIFERPGSVESEHLAELLRSDEDDAVRFTRALVHAVDDVTDISTSPGKNHIVPNVAEYAAEEIGLDLPGYNLSTAVSAEPINSTMDDEVNEESIRERPNGIEAGILGMQHLSSHLTYETEDGFEIKYVENTKATPERYFLHAIRSPDQSVYSTSMDEDGVDMPNGDVQFPEHYVTGLELKKGLRMQEEGFMEGGTVERAFVTGALEIIDDGLNNLSQLMANSNEGYDIELSDSFVESADGMTEDISRENFENYRNIGRAVYQIFENQLGEDFKGEPLRGYDQPLKIDGTLEEPEFYHLEGERRVE